MRTASTFCARSALFKAAYGHGPTLRATRDARIGALPKAERIGVPPGILWSEGSVVAPMVQRFRALALVDERTEPGLGNERLQLQDSYAPPAFR